MKYYLVEVGNSIIKLWFRNKPYTDLVVGKDVDEIKLRAFLLKYCDIYYQLTSPECLVVSELKNKFKVKEYDS